jgi:thiol-disulfide isomerase/thioredoxin
MRKRLPWLLGMVVAAAALGAGFWIGATNRDAASPSSAAIANLQSRQFTDVNGAPATLAQWQGKIVVVNFWATWCPPCREEIPGLIRAQTKWADKGVQVVGIAIDSRSNVAEFAPKMGFNYPLLLGGAETVDALRALGNPGGGLPFTVILDRRGALLAKHLGLLTEDELDRLVAGKAG